jgi:uncharacterized membrane protein YhaH (DUF805 family)
MQATVLSFPAAWESSYQILTGTYFIQAVLSYYPTIAQTHKRLHDQRLSPLRVLV